MGFLNFIYAVKGVINIIRGKVAPTLYMEEIEEHFERLFGVKDSSEHKVLHELMSEKVHIDLHLLYPAENRPFYVLFTTGMSDLPMTLPEDTSWADRRVYERAELFCLLPPDWITEFPKNTPENERLRYTWIFSALKSAARFPHMNGCFFGSNHTLQYTEENAPFADNTKLCSAIFLHLDDRDFGGKYGEDFSFLRTGDGSYINLLCFVPLYEDELNFKHENGSDELFMRMLGETVTDFSQLIIRPDRKSVALNSAI